jgi:hypothetical protein
VYATDVLRLRPKAFDPELAGIDLDVLQEAAKPRALDLVPDDYGRAGRLPAECTSSTGPGRADVVIAGRW